jgi:hypothetical protein
MGGSDWDSGSDLVVDGSGNIYVSGFSGGNWGTPVESHAGSNDGFAAKLNSSGVLQWSTFMGSSGWDNGPGIAIDTAGNSYITGQSDSTWGTPIDPFAGGSDVFATKLDSFGVRQWNTFLGSSTLDEGGGMAMDGSGFVYVTGSSAATWGTPVNAHAGSHDAFVAKFSIQLPKPDIKANGSDGPITISKNDILSVTVSMDAGIYRDDDADICLVVHTPLPSPHAWYHYDLATKSWKPGISVSYQGALKDINPKKVFYQSGLKPGLYTFHFGVDMIMNGSLDYSQAFHDKVKVTITN